MKKLKSIAFFTAFMIYFLSGCLQSCKTTKIVTKDIVKYDSTSIRENAALKRVLVEEMERHEKEKEQWESTGVVFNDTPCPDSAMKIITKIVFDNGKIKSIEGNVRSLNQSLYEKSYELLDAHATIDSLTMELERQETKVVTQTVTITKNIKTKVYPMSFYIIFLIAGLFIEYKFKPLQRVMSFFKQKINI